MKTEILNWKKCLSTRGEIRRDQGFASRGVVNNWHDWVL